jgi:hypothetical protein
MQEAGLWHSAHAYVDDEPATSTSIAYSDYQRELRATAVLLGALSEPGPHEAEPLIRECLRTLVLGGAEGTTTAAQISQDEDALTATAADGLRRGRHLRQRIGKLPAIDTGGLLARRCMRQSRAPGRYWIE